MIWASHPNFPSYELSKQGQVRRLKAMGYRPAAGVICGRVTKKGYRQFKLIGRDGQQHYIGAGRLMLETFFGSAPTIEHQAAHNDGDKLNNALTNLRWATPLENTADKEVHGTMCRGEGHVQAKLTDALAQSIRSLFTGKRGDIIYIANKFGLGTSTVSRVVHGKNWQSHVSALDMRRAAS